jgi:hypothetical protein
LGKILGPVMSLVVKVLQQAGIRHSMDYMG